MKIQILLQIFLLTKNILTKDKYQINGTNNFFTLKNKKAITASITNLGDCCNCENEVEYKIRKITKFNENENSKIIKIKKNFIFFLEENIVKIKKLNEVKRNYFLDLVFEKKIEIFESQKEIFFFDLKIEKEFIFFISGNKLLIYEFDINSESIYFEIFLTKNIDFEIKDIINISLKKNIIIFALKNKGLYFYHFNEKKRNFKNIKKVEKKNLLDEDFELINITAPKISKKNNNFEFCKDNNKCFNLENFNFEILIKTKESKKKLKIYLSDILAKKDILSNKNTTLSPKIKNLITLNNINFRIYKSHNNSYYKLKQTEHKQKISKNPSNLIYHKKNKNSLFLAFSNTKKIFFHQVFILKNLKKVDQNTIINKNSIITKTHTFNLQKLVPYLHFEKIQIEIILLHNNFHILINLKGRIFLFKIFFEGIKITCKLRGMHYFNIKCKEKLEISFLDRKNFENGLVEGRSNFSKFEVLVEYQVYRIDFDKLWGFLFIGFLIFLVFIVMRNKQTRFYKKRFGKKKE